ncbi:MAG TPA: DNA primase [Solirubrobacteraceae bacterium]
MALYTNDSKERVRDAVDMIDLVSSRTELRRAGANRYTGLCPFHDERTPSFGINPAEKVYHCFGCGAGGDAFAFVMETEGVDFKGALELLADRYKVALELEDEDPRAAEKRQRNERLLELLERTATYYVRQLWESREAARAREYLAGRGLEEGTLREFRVGYAPSAWDTVLNASRRAGFANRELHEAGLAQQSQKTRRIYDRFRSQITFPLADQRGRVRGFAGRSLVPDADRRGPKYVNSPETDLFHKGGQLFGADIARAPAAKAGSVVVAEGYTDVIALHQAGVRNSVGIMGTSLTEEQVAGLMRLAPLARLALDADAAGREAMLRSARVAADRKLALEVIALPAGEDPADLVRHVGPDELRRRIDDAEPFVRFRVHHALGREDLSDARSKDRVLRELAAVFGLVEAGVERAELERTVANRLNLSVELVQAELQRMRQDGDRPTAGRAAPSAPGPSATTALQRRERTERAFLGYCIAHPRLGAQYLSELDLDADIGTPLVRRAAEHLRAHLDAPTDAVPETDLELSGLVAELAVRATMLADAPRAAFEAERLQLSLFRIEREIAAARSRGEPVTELAEWRGAIQAQIDRAMDQVMERGSTPR